MMITSYLYIIVASALRLLPHPWNITPIGSMFLFGGATFRNRRASLLVPLAALLATDYAVIRFLYHGQYAWSTPYTWTGFLLVGLIGWTLRSRITWARVVLASVAGSIVFFLVSNFGVWIQWSMYPRTFGGLIECYTAALPFFRNTLLGDLAYAAAMFGSYYLLQQRRDRVAAAS